MNIIGDFGRFIIQYQNQIGIVLVVLLVSGAVILTVRAVATGQKKRRLLSQISDTVTEISSAVNSLSSRKSDVIYIDNRASAGDRTEPAQRNTPEQHPETSAEKQARRTEPAAEMAAEADILRRIADACREEGLAEPEHFGMAGQAGAPEIEQDVPKKFFSRDCSVSKNGTAYTEKELNEQIKE